MSYSGVSYAGSSYAGSVAGAEWSATAFGNIILANTPYAYYPLDETTGTTMHDRSGNAIDGTYSGTPTLGASAIGPIGGSSVRFDGTNGQYGSASLSFTATNTFTFECVIKWISFRNSGTSGVNAIGQIGTETNLFARAGDAGVSADRFQGAMAGSALTDASNVFALATPYHFALRSNGTAKTAWINGRQVSTNTISGNISNGTMKVPWEFDDTRGSDCYLQHVAVHTTALSDADIQARAAALGTLFDTRIIRRMKLVNRAAIVRGSVW